MIGLLIGATFITLIPYNGVTERAGYASMYEDRILVAHNYLAGDAFYNLELGEAVTVNGREYTVDMAGAYAFGHPTEEWAMRVDGDWVMVWDVFEMYSCDGCITLATCFPRWGEGQTTGRYFVRLKPQRNYDDCIRHLSQSC